MRAAVDMRLESYTIVGDFWLERLDLETTRIGEDGVSPIHKSVETAKMFDSICSGMEVEMIIIGKNYLGTDVFQIWGGERFDASCCAYWHEDWSLYLTMRGSE